MKKLIIFIIAIIITFLACSNKEISNNHDNKNSINTTETENNQEKPYIPDNLPDRDFENYTFRIYTKGDAEGTIDLYAESETGDLVNDAVYKRQITVEERFNIKIVQNYYDANDYPANAAQRSILAGDDVIDLLTIHGASTGSIIQAELVLDLLTNMPYINFDAPWWSQDEINNLQTRGKLYFLTGDISYFELASTGCMFFNKGLFVDLKIDYPYNDVIAGKWTLDKFISTVKANTVDINGDGEIKPDDDRIGVEFHNDWNYIVSVFYCGGDRVITSDTGGNLTLTVFNERTVNIFDKFFDMLKSETAFVYEYTKPGNEWQNTAFRGGRALFFTAYLQDVITHRDLEYDIGILPYPKYDEATPKYFNNVDAGAAVFLVPITASNTERTSIIIEAFSAEGYRTVTPAFYELSLKTKFSRDNESEAMLDYIKDGLIYDYAHFYREVAGDLSFIGRSLYKAKDPNFASFYEANKDKAQANIDKLYQ
ncbi:MAG: ABC transporter substrate-binding protein [Oscillospiraceae bacterium]|nr:ABC transporter substrate-binding protein [Oscillospiraceae bacterium]